MMKIDIIIIGNQGSGKTSITNRYIHNNEEELTDDVFTHKYTATVGMNMHKKVVEVKDKDGATKNVELHIWDTAGQEKFFSLTKSFFRRAHGVLVVYDVTDERSYQKIEEFWIKQVNDNCKESTEKMLIGNKIDLTEKREIERKSGENLAKKFNILFNETSAKYGEGINQVFQVLGQKCYEQLCNQIEEPENEDRFEVTGNKKGGVNCWESFRRMFWSSTPKNSSVSAN